MPLFLHSILQPIRAMVMALTLLGASIPAAYAQRTPLNTLVVQSGDGSRSLGIVTSPQIQFVEFVLVTRARFRDPGYISQPLEVTLNAPVGAAAKIEIQKLDAGGGGPVYPATFPDGRKSIVLKKLDPFEAYADIIAQIFPGVTPEQLRRMYTEEELLNIIENFGSTEPTDPYKNGVKALAVLHKDACAREIQSYIVKLVVDLRGVDPADRAGGQTKIWAVLATLPPDAFNHALVKKGGPTDGALNGKRIVIAASRRAAQARLYYVRYVGNRRVNFLRAKKAAIYRHRVYGSMLEGLVPTIKKAAALTIEQVSADGKSVYGFCAKIQAKTQKINGYKKG